MAWKTVQNEEALKTRAELLHTAPLEIPKSVVNSMVDPYDKAFILGLYTLEGNQYVLPETALPLSDADRLRIIECVGLPNAIEMILVTIESDCARLAVHFYNRNYFKKISTDASAGTPPAHYLFTIDGGQRLKAGYAEDQVKVEAIQVHSSDPVITLEVRPIGDYSTYTLSINTIKYPNIDPLFNDVPFKFRPGCFSTNCAPQWQPSKARPSEPAIDYLAKDYDSFKHTLISALMQRVPGWQATSEADLDQVTLELFCVAADELSDFQDRVVNEAYLGLARKRVSVARHARLMDYHIHQGNQADTWLALFVAEDQTTKLPEGFAVWAGNDEIDASAVLFVTRAQADRLTLFGLDQKYANDFVTGTLSASLIEAIERHGISLSTNRQITTTSAGRWILEDKSFKRIYYVERKDRHLVFSVDNQYHYLLNRMRLYTWSNAVPTLEAASTAADLQIEPGLGMTEEDTAFAVQNLLCEGNAPFILLQEWLNPATGRVGGRDPEKRQLLELLKGRQAAQARRDPVTGQWYVHIHWHEKDKLKKRFCFLVDCPNQKVGDVSLFHGNLTQIYHGWPKQTIFRESKKESDAANVYAFERTRKEWCLCRLPADHLLAYRDTPPGGSNAAQSTLRVEIETSAGITEPWEEVISLVNSDDSHENGDHFVVETDELGRSLLRFGNGTNGRKLPLKCEVRCRYQVGRGPDGDVGADTLVHFNPEEKHVLKFDPPVWEHFFKHSECPDVTKCWNPFDVINGRGPEPVEEIIRRVPEFFRRKQLRAVTLRDYEKRAEELPEVSRATARYQWTGSWRTVRITIDPKGTTKELPRDIRTSLADHLNAVRLIGEDLEIRAPLYVPLELNVTLCIHPDYWPEDVRHILEQEFSTAYTPDGRMGFFHPDRWTFGQPLRASQILGRIQAVSGVDHVKEVTMERMIGSTPGHADAGVIEVRPNEIILVENDPDHLEKGYLFFNIRGGRR